VRIRVISWIVLGMNAVDGGADKKQGDPSTKPHELHEKEVQCFAKLRGASVDRTHPFWLSEPLNAIHAKMPWQPPLRKERWSKELVEKNGILQQR